MAIFLINARKIGSDDISWGMATLNYTDYNGVNRHIPQVNAFVVPYTVSESVGAALDTLFNDQLDIIVVDTAADFTTALTTLGSDEGTIYLRRGSYTFTVDPAVPDNVRLWFENGAVINASNATVTISGPIEAGIQQIFSWVGTGAIDITNSPNSIVYPEWWGAIAETSGFTNDNIASLDMMISSISGQRQLVQFGMGWYRIASALSVGINGARWQGSGIFQSGIWIDIGGAGTGVTFGVLGSVSEAVELSDMSFLGPAACCAYGVDFISNNPHVRRVNFYMGASSYACRTRSTEVYEMNPIYFVPNNGNPATTACPAGAFTADKDPILGWANNTAILNINTQGNFTIPCVYLNGTGTNITLSGTIQGSAPAAATEPLRMVGCETTHIKDLYTEAFSGDINIISCIVSIAIDNILFFNNTNFNIINCQGVEIGPSWIFGTLYINAGCRGVKVNSLTCLEVIDDAPDTEWDGRRTYSYDYGAQKAKDKVNVWKNAGFNRWQTSQPDYFTDSWQVTWTKSGVGIGAPNDVHHFAPFCAKAVTNGGPGSWKNVLDATQLSRLRGRVATTSLWEYFPTGQTLDDKVTPNTIPLNWNVTATVPDWVGSTAYYVNDAVHPSAAWLAAHPLYTGDGVSDMQWVCTVAGTSGVAEPTWGTGTTLENTVVTDGGVTWVSKVRNADILHSNYYHATMQGSWHQDSLSLFVANNATDFTVSYNLAQQPAAAGEATVFLADPALVVSNQTPMALVESAGEFQNYIQVGANKISWGTAVPVSGWCQQGDLMWRTDATAAQSPGWICTTSGVGGAAVWKAMANVAA